MYQSKTAGILELLMNALSFPASRSRSVVRQSRPLPVRREEAVQRALRSAAQQRETYFATARLLWWNR